MLDQGTVPVIAFAVRIGIEGAKCKTLPKEVVVVRGKRRRCAHLGSDVQVVRCKPTCAEHLVEVISRLGRMLTRLAIVPLRTAARATE